MRICVLSYLATYGNAPLLARALGEIGHDVTLILRYRNARGQGDYGFADELPHLEADLPEGAAKARAAVAECEAVVVMAMPSLAWLVPRVGAQGKPGAIVLSSSHLMMGLRMHRRKISRLRLSPIEFNRRMIADSGLGVFVQPHKYVYVATLEPPPKVYYPPMPKLNEPIPRAAGEPIRIGHSPGKPSREHWKGTDLIRKVFARIQGEYGSRVRCCVLPEQEHGPLVQTRRTFDV